LTPLIPRIDSELRRFGILRLSLRLEQAERQQLFIRQTNLLGTFWLMGSMGAHHSLKQSRSIEWSQMRGCNSPHEYSMAIEPADIRFALRRPFFRQRQYRNAKLPIFIVAKVKFISHIRSFKDASGEYNVAYHSVVPLRFASDAFFTLV
jgi:hypothetical protein